MWTLVSFGFILVPPVVGFLTGFRRPRWGWTGLAVAGGLYLVSYMVISPGVAWPVSHSWSGWFLYVVFWVGITFYAGYGFGWLTRRERRRDAAIPDIQE
jgi:hypothetical protein